MFEFYFHLLCGLTTDGGFFKYITSDVPTLNMKVEDVTSCVIAVNSW